MTSSTDIPVNATKKWRVSAWLLIITLILTAGGLAISTTGFKWLTTALSQLSSDAITVSGASGSLLNNPGAQTLILTSPDLVITAHDIRLIWQPAALLSGKFDVLSLQVGDMDILSLPSPYPDSLSLPLALSIKELAIGKLQLFSKPGTAADFSARNMNMSLQSDGVTHRLQGLQAELDYGTLNASGQMNGKRPFMLQANLELVGLTQFNGSTGENAHFFATASGNLGQLILAVKGSGTRLSGQGKLQLRPYDAFPLTALQLKLDGLNPHDFSPDTPNAALSVQTDLRVNTAGQLAGNITASNPAAAPLDRAGLPLAGVQAYATLSAQALQLDNLSILLPDRAAITGKLHWQRKQATASADLLIHQLDPAQIDTRLRAAKLNGSLKISGDQTRQTGVLSLSDGTLQLTAQLGNSANTLTLTDLMLRRDKASLSGTGKLELGGRRGFSLNGQLQHFDLAAFMHAPTSDLNATLDASGFLAPESVGKVSFTIKNSSLASQPVTGSGLIEFSKSPLIRTEGELRLGDNHLTVKGRLGRTGDTLQLELDAPKLAQLGNGFGGTLNVHAVLGGIPLRPDVDLQATGLELTLPGEQHLASLNMTTALHGEALTLLLEASGYHSPALSIQDMQIGGQGSPSHHELTARVQLSADRLLTLRAGGGLLDIKKGWDSMRWQGELTELSGTGILPFKLLNSTPLLLGREHAMLDASEFSMAGGSLHLGKLNWTAKGWDSRGQFTGIGLHVGLQPGHDTLHLGGEWHLGSTEINRLKIMRESGDWILPGEQPTPLGLDNLQLTAHTEHGKLAAELTAHGRALGDWNASIALPLIRTNSFWRVADTAPLTGSLHINTPNLAWLGPAINDNLKFAGQLVLDAAVTGSYAHPGLYGQVEGHDLELALLDQNVRLVQGKLLAHFDQFALHLDKLNFIAPHDPQPRDSLLKGLNMSNEAGKLNASGILNLDGTEGNLEIVATELPLSQRADRWIIVSGNGHARLQKNFVTLGGKITANGGLISQPKNDRPQLSDDIVIIGKQETTQKGPQLTVDATLNLGEHFFLRASGLEARLAGQLDLQGAPGQLLNVTGSIAARDASFQAYGQNLSVERGIVNFQGPLYDPGLNILAVRRGLSVEAGVAVTGSARHPAIKLVSTPTVPDVEKLSWIVLGRAPSSTGTDSSMLLSAAGSILGGTGGLTGSLKQALGVDELSLQGNGSTDPLANNNPLSSQIVTVGKRLSSRAFISYAQGVTAVAGITKLTYSLTPRVNIVTQTGLDDAIDIFYTFSFH